MDGKAVPVESTPGLAQIENSRVSFLTGGEVAAAVAREN
jgi:hypothetical protein